MPAPPVRALLERLFAARSVSWVALELGKDPSNVIRAGRGEGTSRVFAEAVEALARQVFDEHGRPREAPARRRRPQRRRPQGSVPTVVLRIALPAELVAAVRARAEKRDVSMALAVEELLQAMLSAPGDEEQAA